MIANFLSRIPVNAKVYTDPSKLTLQEELLYGSIRGVDGAMFEGKKAWAVGIALTVASLIAITI